MTALLVLRAFWPSSTVVPVLVEVTGDVAKPGTYALDTPTVREALSAAGADPTRGSDRILTAGQRVVVSAEEILVAEPQTPVLVALPVDPNTATKVELMAIPGLGRRLTEAVLEDRRQHGPFRGIESLTRVPGLGRDALNRIEPFIALSHVPMLDLNHAPAGELETLPGIGPVLAARIVVDRAENGLYENPLEVERVRGVSHALAVQLAPQVVANP